MTSLYGAVVRIEDIQYTFEAIERDEDHTKLLRIIVKDKKLGRVTATIELEGNKARAFLTALVSTMGAIEKAEKAGTFQTVMSI
jgi:hypothetical protein